MTENDQMKITEARNSFTGKSLTASQFDEAWTLAGVMNRHIRKSGSFRDKLTDYAHAFARTEKFDQVKGETIIRDIYKSRYGQSMNQTREALMEREIGVRDNPANPALRQAQAVLAMIQEGETMPFYQAYDKAAVTMSMQHEITEASAKDMMKSAYRANEGHELYDAGKSVEEELHAPVREKARVERDFQRGAAPGRTPTPQP